MSEDMKQCPYYQGVCGLDESYICYCAGYPNSCEIFKKHEETRKEGDGGTEEQKVRFDFPTDEEIERTYQTFKDGQRKDGDGE